METNNLKETLINFLEANQLSYIDRGDKISHCCINPAHIEEHPSAYTDFRELPYTHCSSCGFHLNTEALYEFLELGFDQNMLFEMTIQKLLDKKLIKQEDVGSVFLPIKYKNFDKPYRKISAETFAKVSAYYTEPDAYYSKRIIIPIKNYEDNVKGFEAVSTSKDIVPKILRPKNFKSDGIFGFENLIKSDTVWICEGIFNALSFIECNFNGLMNFGVASISNKIKVLLLKGVKNVVLCGDNDDAGRNFNKECYKILRKYGFNVLYFKFPYEFKDINKFDINDLLKAYGSEKFKDYVVMILEKNLIKIERK